jgi:hypothetical protein
VLLEEPPEPGVADGEDDLSGFYELTCHSWDELYVVLIPNPVNGVLGEHERFRQHLKGDIVNLEHKQAKRLLAAGAVVVPGTVELARAEAAEHRAVAAAAEAKAARQRAEQVHASVADKASQGEVWKAGSAAGDQRRAADAVRAAAARAAQPGSLTEALDASGLTGPSVAP